MEIKTKELGFTLIEMIVTIAILAVLLSLLSANFDGTADQRNLAAAKSLLISNLHKMQSYALSSRAFDSTTNPITPAGYWDFHIDLSASDGAYQTRAFDNSEPPDGLASSVDNVLLPSNVYIKYMLITVPGLGMPTCVTVEDMKFTVPYNRILSSGNYVQVAGHVCPISGQPGNDIPNATTAIFLSTRDNQFNTIITVNGITGNITY